MGRADHRARPSSSPATRHLDNKIRDSNSSSVAGFRSAWIDTGVSAVNWRGGDSYSVRVSEAAHIGLGSQTSGLNAGQAALGLYPNAWTSRKDATLSALEPVQSAWSEQTAASKLAHASALEKVSSGRWQSKQSLQAQKDIKFSKHSEVENGLPSQGYGDKMYSRMSFAGGREYSDVTLARSVEKGLNIGEGIHGGGRKELPNYERNHSLNYLVHGERVRSTHSDGKLGGYELLLQPRTKPLDGPKSPVVEPKQGHHRQSEPVLTHAGIGNNAHGRVYTSKPGLAGSESWNQTVDRPKPNLKPRSHLIELLEGHIEKEGSACFSTLT
ncbi:uncharacterized protein LOC120152517 [Hibiscus syriacus]|uniref:uncharacterized protein LOC120152517 n=1 Tax=Hibiscus syriacus TaxID=106335 RepID=UPI001923E574|nr:uncharacterized protein LOC120152517 [Hibiscus syriacus]